MSGTVIRVEGLSKRYRLGERQKYRTFRDLLVTNVMNPSKWFFRRHQKVKRNSHFWALQDITFDVQEGEILGIIGRNGAGKSTLLKILSRITKPTRGSVKMRGRAGSLLEVGTGFHPELTGRENIYLNGAILGMHRAEIERKFDEIVTFADVERFLDTPVKHYSSGMYVRLAFAVAAHLEPEILIVDEVLAVGDAAFQKKCLGKMSEVASGGRTVLFVSHNMSAIQRLCLTSLLLEKGRLVRFGPTQEILNQYLAICSSYAPDSWIEADRISRKGTGLARVTAFRYSSGAEDYGNQPYPMGPLEVELRIQAETPQRIDSLAITLYDRYGTKLVNADVKALGQEVRLPGGESHLRFSIPALYLNPGIYQFGWWLGDIRGKAIDYAESAMELEVVELKGGLTGIRPLFDGAVACPFDFQRMNEPGSPVRADRK